MTASLYGNYGNCTICALLLSYRVVNEYSRCWRVIVLENRGIRLYERSA